MGFARKKCQTAGLCQVHTGKSLSEALILASTNCPQYDDRLFIELQV